MLVSGLRNRAVRFGYCGRGRLLGLPRLCFFGGGWWLPVGSRRDAGSGQGFPPFPAWPGPGGCVSGARFPAGSPVPVGGGDGNPRAVTVLKASLLKIFSKISWKKVWRNGKKQYFCGPVSRERGGRGRQRGREPRGKKLFEKFLRKSLAVQKKDVLLHPQTERGGDRVGREAGDGARRKPGGDGS